MNEKNIFSSLRTPGLLGKRPIIGLIMFVIGSLIFAALAFNLVKHGPLIKWDLAVSAWFHALALKSSPLVIDIMIAGWYVGKEGIIVIAIVLVLYFLYKKFWCELAMVVASLGLSGLIFLLLSHIFNRPRPFLSFDKPLWTGSPNIPGFPSGHTLSVVVCFGFLMYVLVPRIKSYFSKSLVVMIALLVIFYVGFSRLYLGDHYLTDVIAGYAVGIAWLGVACTSVEVLFQKYRKKKNESY